MRGAMRLLLAVPVQGTGSTTTQTAAVSFGLSADGLLSQVDGVADALSGLQMTQREVLLPIPLLDSIQSLSEQTPAPSGTVLATLRGDADRLQIRSQEALPTTLSIGDQVRLRDTRSYNGPYRVVGVSDNTFEVEASGLSGPRAPGKSCATRRWGWCSTA